MTPRRISIATIAAVLLTLAGTGRVSGETERGTGGIPVPIIPQGQGEACVADTALMRRNHMTLLKHQRDETMRQGIRGNPYSLEECIACHAVSGPDGQALTVDSPKHFCRSCHDYAAVSIDCFQCHASRPEPALATGGLGQAGGTAAAGSARQ